MSTLPRSTDYDDDKPPLPPRRRGWKTITAWIAGIMLVLAALLWIGAIALLHNNSFRQYLLRIAHTKINEAVGIEVRMRDFSVHWSGMAPAVDMYDVVIDAAAPYQTEPLLKADHLSVGIQIVSLLQRKWYLKDIVIDRPVARVFVAENGDTNLPKLKSAGESTSVFDLGIRRIMLSQGEVYYNDRKSMLDADLHDIEFQSSFDPGVKRYSGELSYKNGKIHFQDLNPVVHNLEAEFDATADTFNVKRGLLTSGASQVTLNATLKDYAKPKLTAQYESSLDIGELRKLLNDTTLPVGIVKLAGSASFQSDPKQPALETLLLDGNISSDALQIHTAAMHTQVRKISGEYTLKQGSLEVRNLRAQLLGGGMDGTFKIRDVTDTQVSELQATLRNIPLAGIQALVNPKSMRDLRLTGAVNAKLDANWRKALVNLVAHADADFKGSIVPTSKLPKEAGPPPAAAPVLAEGSIRVQYSAAAEEISFAQSYIRTAQTSLNLNGTVSKTASLEVQVQSNDLHEIETIAGAFGVLPQPLELGGTASFAGTVRGSPANLQIAGQLSAVSLKVKGTEWRTVRTIVEADPSHLALRDGDLVPANNRGRLSFNVNLGLDQWTFGNTSPIQMDLNASQLNVADLKSLAGSQLPVSGTLSANVSLHGSQLNPAGKGKVTLSQAAVSDEPIQSASLDFQGDGDEIRGRLELRVPAGTVQSTLTYSPKRKAYDGQLQASGIRLDQFRTLRARNLNLAGTLDLSAKGSGTFDDPGLQFTLRIPQLQLQNQTINGFTLQADIADHVATVAMDSQALALNNSFVRGHGKVNLTGAYETDATFDTSAISLQPLIAAYLPEQSADLSGQTEVHATVKGPLRDNTLLDAHITIPTLSLKYKTTTEFAAVQPIQLDYSRGVVTLQKTAIRGTGTDVQLQGTIPVTGTAPMSLLALGTIDLRIAQMFYPDITSSGQIQFNIDGTGRGANPNVQGQIKIVNAALAGASLPVGLQNGNGALTLTSSRLEIDSFAGKISGGTLTATGGVTYRPSLQFNLAVAANGIRTSYPQGVREGIAANLALVGSQQAATLRGQVQLTELSFSPSFDLDDVAGVFGGGTANTTPPDGFARNLNLDITVVSANDLNLASTKLSLQGTANLRIRGTAAEPAVIGRVNLNGGELFYRGNRYFIEASSLDFIDPYRIEPRMNLSVSTKVQDYNIRMLFRGTTDQLRTTYTSEPPLSSASIINLLVFGKTSEAQAVNPTSNLETAKSAIASELASGIEKVSGISQVSIDLGSSQQDSSTRLTIQQRVTGNLFVTYSTDATSTERQTIKIDYQATPRVGLSGVRDQNGGLAFDVRIKKTW